MPDALAIPQMQALLSLILGLSALGAAAVAAIAFERRTSKAAAAFAICLLAAALGLAWSV
jgi:hypothetical protein